MWNIQTKCNHMVRVVAVAVFGGMASCGYSAESQPAPNPVPQALGQVLRRATCAHVVTGQVQTQSGVGSNGSGYQLAFTAPCGTLEASGERPRQLIQASEHILSALDPVIQHVVQALPLTPKGKQTVITPEMAEKLAARLPLKPYQMALRAYQQALGNAPATLQATLGADVSRNPQYVRIANADQIVRAYLKRAEEAADSSTGEAENADGMGVGGAGSGNSTALDQALQALQAGDDTIGGRGDSSDAQSGSGGLDGGAGMGGGSSAGSQGATGQGGSGMGFDLGATTGMDNGGGSLSGWSGINPDPDPGSDASGGSNGVLGDDALYSVYGQPSLGGSAKTASQALVIGRGDVFTAAPDPTANCTGTVQYCTAAKQAWANRRQGTGETVINPTPGGSQQAKKPDWCKLWPFFCIH